MNPLQTWANLNVGELNAHALSRNTGTSPISYIWFFILSIINWDNFSLPFPSSLETIKHTRISNLIFCQLSSWNLHIWWIWKRCFINIKTLIHNFIVFITLILSTNISIRYLSFRWNFTLSMIFCSAVFIIGEEPRNIKSRVVPDLYTLVITG